MLFIAGIQKDLIFEFNADGSTKCHFIQHSFQAMLSVAVTFVFSVLSFYTFYRYIIDPTEFFKQMALIHFFWQSFYLIYAFMIIYAGSVIKSKVSNRNEIEK